MGTERPPPDDRRRALFVCPRISGRSAEPLDDPVEHSVSALMSAGSTAGNMPTRSWLRPSLR